MVEHIFVGFVLTWCLISFGLLLFKSRLEEHFVQSLKPDIPEIVKNLHCHPSWNQSVLSSIGWKASVLESVPHSNWDNGYYHQIVHPSHISPGCGLCLGCGIAIWKKGHNYCDTCNSSARHITSEIKTFYSQTLLERLTKAYRAVEDLKTQDAAYNDDATQLTVSQYG